MQNMDMLQWRIPDAGMIPVPWGWFQGLLSVTFVLHLLVMNILLGTFILATVYSLSPRQLFSRHAAGNLAVRDDFFINALIIKKLPVCMALSINAGVAPLLFLQVLYGHLFYVGDIIMGWYWLFVFVLAMLAYYGAYGVSFFVPSAAQHKAHAGFRICLVGTTVLLLWISFMFTNNMTLLHSPARWLVWFNDAANSAGSSSLNLADPVLFPRWLHFVIASVAVAALALGLYWQHRQHRAQRQQALSEAACHGACVTNAMKWFTGATLTQFVVGGWFFVSLPRETGRLFIQGPVLHQGIFIAGLTGAVLLVVLGWKKQVRACAGMLVCTVGCMVCLRELLRMELLAPYFTAGSHSVQGQYSPLIMFFIAFVIVMWIIGYILKLAAGAGRDV